MYSLIIGLPALMTVLCMTAKGGETVRLLLLAVGY